MSTFLGAILTLTGVCAQEPSESALAFGQAVELFDDGQLEAAERMFLQMDPQETPLVYSYLGAIRKRMNDPERAGEYFRQGAELNEPNSMFYLADMLDTGSGMEQDRAAAFALFKKVADMSGDPISCFKAAIMLFIGDDVPQDTEEGEKYLMMAADSNQDNPVVPLARHLLGVYYAEQGKLKQATRYLELAAEQGVVDAWRRLGVIHFEDSEGRALANDLRWAKLCFLAAERLEPDSATEYNLGLVAVCEKNPEDVMRWMTLAKENGDELAKKFLEDIPAQAAIPAVAPGEDSELPAALPRIWEEVTERIGADGCEALRAMGAHGVDSGCQGNVLLLSPLPEGLAMPGWTYQAPEVKLPIEENVFYDRDGNERWMDERFLEEPLEKNLWSFHLTMRKINSAGVGELVHFLSGVFPSCRETEASELLDLADGRRPNGDERVKDWVWKIRDGLFFHLREDGSGGYGIRSYRFIRRRGEEAEVVMEFGSAPEVAGAALVEGILQGSSDCRNNQAVILLATNRQVYEEVAEGILQELAAEGHAVATYNLGEMCLAKGDLPQAAECFARTRQLLGLGERTPECPNGEE
ncbi:MAG: sel1 repeat family protein [Victivallales bacterium]|nr:sel1 repeat family protein [Victivallales bacterium]